MSRLGVVIPALNEEETIGAVVAEVRQVAEAIRDQADIAAIFVVDNGSTDQTAARAAAAGASVVSEPRRGYGRACLTGAEAARDVEYLVFLDGDRSDRPSELPLLLAPILSGKADLMLGSRRGGSEPGALSPQQVVGNRIAAVLLRQLFHVPVTDVGPFRIIRRDLLLQLGMREMTYGWPVEMIARAARQHLRVAEVSVSCRRRGGGQSKVGGNLIASVRAGVRMLVTIARCYRRRPLAPAVSPPSGAATPESAATSDRGDG